MLKEECDAVISHETVGQVLLKTNILRDQPVKKPLLSAVKNQRCFSFAMTNISQPVTYRDDVIFCDETKIMLHYNDGPSKVLQKQSTALENRNIVQ